MKGMKKNATHASHDARNGWLHALPNIWPLKIWKCTHHLHIVGAYWDGKKTSRPSPEYERAYSPTSENQNVLYILQASLSNTKADGQRYYYSLFSLGCLVPGHVVWWSLQALLFPNLSVHLSHKKAVGQGSQSETRHKMWPTPTASITHVSPRNHAHHWHAVGALSVFVW